MRRGMPITSLVGREREIAVVRGMLAREAVRLVTLTGPGGSGKTRLALAVAAEAVEDFEGGFALVSLAPIVDPALVMPAIAAELGLRDVGARPLIERLYDHIGERRMLLVLDNFEQVLDAGPSLVELLSACPRAKLLVTSRSVLRVSGEHRFPVPPLPVPDPSRVPSLDGLRAFAAVELFVQRAQGASPELALTEANAADIVEICARLDGLPLALELAAARLAVLTPAALLAELRRRGDLGLLNGGPRDAPERQRTLPNTIGWSYELLAPEECRLLRALSVFAGGCELGAAREVFGGDPVDGSATLLDNSLVQRQEAGDEPRISMLETVRAYGLERLADERETDAVERRHAAWCARLVEEGERRLSGPEQRQMLDRLEREHDNLRAAFGSSMERGEIETALRLASIWQFFLLRGHLDEWQRRVTEALARDDGAVADGVRVRALRSAGYLAFYKGDYAGAVRLHEESVGMARAMDDASELAASLDALGLATLLGGDPLAAKGHLQESLGVRRTSGQVQGTAYTLLQLGLIGPRDTDEAQRLVEESLRLYEERGDRWGAGSARHALGMVAFTRHEYRRARGLFVAGLEDAYSLDHSVLMCMCLDGLAWVAAAEGKAELAALVTGAADARRELGGVPRTPSMFANRERSLQSVRRKLGDAAVARLLERGRGMSVGEILEMTEQPGRATRAARPAGLTRREVEVLRLLATGLSNAELAERLVLSPRTVDAHLVSIYGKLGVTSRSAATRFAFEQGLVDGG